jgi:hypothetical protein
MGGNGSNLSYLNLIFPESAAIPITNHAIPNTASKGPLLSPLLEKGESAIAYTPAKAASAAQMNTTPSKVAQLPREAPVRAFRLS